MADKSKAEIATIDCTMVTVETSDGKEFGFNTASNVAVEVQTTTTDAVRLIIKGVLKSQKPEETTITGNQITMTDNVFNPELVLVLQGGKIIYDTVDASKIIGYDPPVAGDTEDKGDIFKLNCYSSQYDAAGKIINYEKITYPNCQGVPVAFSSEDNVFRVPSYTINSAPNTGESPYTLRYVESLPKLV